MSTATLADLDAVERLFLALPPEKRKELVATPAVRWRLGATCDLTDRQLEAEALLESPATHCMLFGGSRSGKTFLIVRKIVQRALQCQSRHAIMRFRFSHVVTSVAMDTLPKVMKLCFPGAAADSKLDKQHWCYVLPNKSEVWFGGLDDKERTEKILGQEYASLFLNECSQIPQGSRDMATTRLAQDVDQVVNLMGPAKLRPKMFYDCNPPSKGHWTYRMFV